MVVKLPVNRQMRSNADVILNHTCFQPVGNETQIEGLPTGSVLDYIADTDRSAESLPLVRTAHRSKAGTQCGKHNLTFEKGCV